MAQGQTFLNPAGIRTCRPMLFPMLTSSTSFLPGGLQVNLAEGSKRFLPLLCFLSGMYSVSESLADRVYEQTKGDLKWLSKVTISYHTC